MGITILPPRRFWFLILFSFCLPTVQLHFTPILNKAHTQKKNLSLVFSYPLYMYISILFFRKQTTHTHTRTHKELSWDVINFLLLWSSALLFVLVLISLLLSFSVQFLFREVLLPHCRFKGYNAINTWYLKIPSVRKPTLPLLSKSIMLLYSFQSLQKFSCSWLTSVPFWRGRFPCNIAAHCIAEVLIVRLKSRVFSRVLSESLSSARPSTVTISPKHGQQRRTLVDNSTSWRAPPPYFPSSLLTKQRTAANGRKSERSSIGPAFVELRAMTQASKAWKIPTHTSRSRRPSFFSFDAPSSITLSSPSLFSSSKPPPESGAPLIPVGFAVFNRRVMQLASRGECDRARAGSSLVDFEGTFFFFFWYFRNKATRAGDEKQRKK